MGTQNNEMTVEEYKCLQRVFSNASCITDWGEMIGNVAAGLKARAALADPDCWDMGNLSSEVYREQNFFELLCVLNSIHDNHNGNIRLPDLTEMKKGGES